MTRLNVQQFERVFLLAFWLFSMWIRWSPWPGGAVIEGPQSRRVEWGFCGYYSVTYDENGRTGQWERDGLVLSGITTVVMSAVCLWGWRRTRCGYGRRVIEDGRHGEMLP